MGQAGLAKSTLTAHPLSITSGGAEGLFRCALGAGCRGGAESTRRLVGAEARPRGVANGLEGEERLHTAAVPGLRRLAVRSTPAS